MSAGILSVGFDCDVCGKTFPYMSKLKSHKKALKSCLVVKQFSCELCAGKFTSRQTLDRHKKISCPKREPEKTAIGDVKDSKRQVVQKIDMTNSTVNGTVNNTNNNIVINVTVVNSFSSGAEVIITPKMFTDTIDEHKTLRELRNKKGDNQYAEGNIPTAFIALNELIKKAHEDPSQQNIYAASSSGPDKLFILTEKGNWKSAGSQNTVCKQLYSTVAEQLLAISLDPRPQMRVDFVKDQTVAGVICFLSSCQTEGEHLDEAKKSLIAHLRTLKKPKGQIVVKVPEQRPLERKAHPSLEKTQQASFDHTHHYARVELDKYLAWEEDINEKTCLRLCHSVATRSKKYFDSNIVSAVSNRVWKLQNGLQAKKLLPIVDALLKETIARENEMDELIAELYADD
jgi:hypothetical protein